MESQIYRKNTQSLSLKEQLELDKLKKEFKKRYKTNPIAGGSIGPMPSPYKNPTE